MRKKSSQYCISLPIADIPVEGFMATRFLGKRQDGAPQDRAVPEV